MDDDDQFKTMVEYFWNEKGNVERYSSWSEERCERVWPAFLHAWRDYKKAVIVLNAITKVKLEDEQ